MMKVDESKEAKYDGHFSARISDTATQDLGAWPSKLQAIVNKTGFVTFAWAFLFDCSALEIREYGSFVLF